MKEKTLEEFITLEIKRVEREKERNLNNIQRLQERLSNANGDEKVRIEELINLQLNHKSILESITTESIEVIAQEKFEKRKIN